MFPSSRHVGRHVIQERIIVYLCLFLHASFNGAATEQAVGGRRAARPAADRQRAGAGEPLHIPADTSGYI